MVYIAIKNEHGIYDFVPTRELAESLHIAAPTATKILQNLSRAGMIETREGARGGVRLAGSPDDLTLLDVFGAIEHERPLFRIDQNIPTGEAVAALVYCRLSEALQSSEQAMKERLQSVTVAGLYR